MSDSDSDATVESTASEAARRRAEQRRRDAARAAAASSLSATVARVVDRFRIAPPPASAPPLVPATRTVVVPRGGMFSLNQVTGTMYYHDPVDALGVRAVHDVTGAMVVYEPVPDSAAPVPDSAAPAPEAAAAAAPPPKRRRRVSADASIKWSGSGYALASGPPRRAAARAAADRIRETMS